MFKTVNHMLKPVKSALIWRWRRGFKATSKTFFDLAHGAGGNYQDYLPDAAFLPMARTNTKHARDILRDKLLFEQQLRDHVVVPENVALIAHGTVRAIVADGIIHNAEDLLEYAREHPLVLKPVSGANGKGVSLLRYEAGTFILDAAPLTPEAVLDYVAQLDGYLVTPWVRPAPYAAAIFPQAGNSIRVITLRDPGDGHRPFVAVAFHKFGTRASAPTDNWVRGGLVAPLDTITGESGAGLKNIWRTKGQPVEHNTHPDTGARIEGVRVPGWQTVQEQLLGMLDHSPHFQYVGWDVLVTETGFSVLEGNAAPSIIQLQLTRPLLGDARVRRFVAPRHQCAGTAKAALTVAL